MARSEARIKTSIWHDPDFTALDPFSQWVYMLAVSQPTVSFCGVTPYTPRRWSGRAKGVTIKDIRKGVETLVAHDYVVVDDDTEELWIRTFVKHDGVLSKPNVTVAMSRDFAAIQSAIISERFLDGLGEQFLQELPRDLRERLAQPFVKRFLKRFPEPFRHELVNPSPNASGIPSGIGFLACAHDAEPPPPASSLQPPPPPGLANGSAATPALDDPAPSKAETENAQKIAGPPDDPLIAQWLTDVLHLPAGKRRTKPLVDAYTVITHLRQHLDEQVIAERIGYLAGLDQRPHSASYLLEACIRWGAERGVEIPPPERP